MTMDDHCHKNRNLGVSVDLCAKTYAWDISSDEYIYIYIIYIIFVDCNQLQLVSKLTSCASPWLLPGDHWDDIRDDQIR